MIGITKHKRAIGSYATATLTLFQTYQINSGHVLVGKSELDLLYGLISLYLVVGVAHAAQKAKKAANGGT